MITISNLSKSLGGRIVLDAVSLQIPSRSVTALVGPSGAGKSTLLRVVAGIETADEGRVELLGSQLRFPSNGKNTRRQNRLWPSLTLVFQGLCLWPHLTLRANVELPLSGAASAKLDHAKVLMGRFGVEHLQERYPNEVSGGQRQLFALIRAFALDPEIVLLDEVTSALDVEKTRVVRESVREFAGSGGTVLVVSHSIEFVRKVADHVIFLDQGKVIEVGQVGVVNRPESPRFRSFLHDADELSPEETTR